MNRLSILLIAALLFLMFFFLVGRWLLLSDLEARIGDEKARHEQSVSELSRLNTEYQGLKTSISSTTSTLPQHWLGIGEEARVFRGLFDAASASQIIMRKFEFLPIFHFKTSAVDTNNLTSSHRSATGELPQFDERTGQAIGAVTDEDDSEWPGVEMLPVRIELKGLYVGIIGFFLKAKQTLPRFQVRSMELNLEESGIVKGKAILVFPILPKVSSLGRTYQDQGTIGPSTLVPSEPTNEGANLSQGGE